MPGVNRIGIGFFKEPPDRAYSGLDLFDLDHTLINFNSSFRFGFYLYQVNEISPTLLGSLVWYYIRHKCFGYSLDGLHQKAFELFFKGRSLNQLKGHAANFVTPVFHQSAHLRVLNRLTLAKQKGHLTCLMSSSPDFIVAPIAQLFGFESYLATHYVVDKEGSLCNILELIDGAKKALYAREMANRFDIPLQEMTAYSDSHLDLAFLEVGGRAVAVNPDRKLRKTSKERCWEIL